VTAVDLSPQWLELARKRVEVYGLQDQVRFYSGSAEELSSLVPIEPHDLTYSFGVIHHTPQPERVMDQMRHYAKLETTVNRLPRYLHLHARRRTHVDRILRLQDHRHVCGLHFPLPHSPVREVGVRQRFAVELDS
jgi:2-polyprenyl-3-methyl-5-hydroxy-6-metoxy-1,4-benzoquinol methylase